jgi:hypothetical protein
VNDEYQSEDSDDTEWNDQVDPDIYRAPLQPLLDLAQEAILDCCREEWLRPPAERTWGAESDDDEIQETYEEMQYWQDYYGMDSEGHPGNIG